MIDLYELLKYRIKNKPYVLEGIKIFYNEMREVFQELMLHGLSEERFFENNSFHGGTCLRLVYGSKRYSEDLDFNMKNDDPDFSWMPYFNKLNEYTKKLGFELIIGEKYSSDKYTVKRLTINGKNMVDIIHNKGIVPARLTKSKNRPNIEIKLETSYYKSRFNSEKKELSFPTIFNIEAFDINCLFAGKLHATLTRTKKIKEKDKVTKEVIREYRVDENKGRDWYDFIWYVQQGIEPNWRYLKEKLKGNDKWKVEDINVDEKWIKEQLKLKMERLDYNKMNIELSDYIKANDNFILNKDIIEKHINMMGKDGYKIKYNKDNDEWN